MKRTTALLCAISILFSSLTFRIISLNASYYSTVNSTQSTKTLTIGTSRANIYYCDGTKAVNNTQKLLCALKPGVYSLSDNNLSQETKETLSTGLPVLTEVTNEIDNDDSMTFEVPNRYDGNNLCSHIIGYTDNSSKGQTGVEKAYDSFLTQNSGKLSVSYSIDATGRNLSGISPKVNDENFNSSAGVVLTIDKKIQQICENAMDNNNIINGACVIVRVNDGSVAGSCSRPNYDQNNIGESLTQNGSPLVNKVFTPYCVGSVFKPIIASYSLTYNINSDFTYNCKGSTTVLDTNYCCNNCNSHAIVNLESALCVSCNTYFINLLKNCDEEELYDFCCNFGFSTGTRFGDGLISAEGSLPTSKELENKGQLANFSFGQGNLTATPLQLACAYIPFCNGGVYKYPYLIKGTIDGEYNFTSGYTKPDSKVLDTSVSEKIKELLQSVVENGNAYNAKSDKVKTAGKTGTAQSGSFDENGNEILRTWFVGFFPADNPKYTVCVMDENGSGGGIDCAPVFREIAENITDLMIE